MLIVSPRAHRKSARCLVAREPTENPPFRLKSSDSGNGSWLLSGPPRPLLRGRLSIPPTPCNRQTSPPTAFPTASNRFEKHSQTSAGLPPVKHRPDHRAVECSNVALGPKLHTYPPGPRLERGPVAREFLCGSELTLQPQTIERPRGSSLYSKHSVSMRSDGDEGRVAGAKPSAPPPPCRPRLVTGAGAPRRKRSVMGPCGAVAAPSFACRHRLSP